MSVNTDRAWRENEMAIGKVNELQAECERLKAELAAWHSQFGSQLSHAVEERERLKAENARLRRFSQDPDMEFDEELGWAHKDSLTIVKELRAENARLVSGLKRHRHFTEVVAHHSGLRGSTEQAEARDALEDVGEGDLPLQEYESRILDAFPDLKPSGGHDYLDELIGLLRVAWSQRDTAEKQLAKAKQRDKDWLGAVLAPTIELLESVLRDDKDCSNRKIESELSSLRSLAGEGKS